MTSVSIAWFVAGYAAVAAFPFAALAVMRKLRDRKLRFETVRLRCGEQEQKPASCVLVRDAKTGETLGIRACSALDDSWQVSCGQTCLSLFVAPPARDSS